MCEQGKNGEVEHFSYTNNDIIAKLDKTNEFLLKLSKIIGFQLAEYWLCIVA